MKKPTSTQMTIALMLVFFAFPCQENTTDAADEQNINSFPLSNYRVRDDDIIPEMDENKDGNIDHTGPEIQFRKYSNRFSVRL